MGLLSDVYLSDSESALNYDGQPERFRTSERIQCKGLTPLEFSTLWAILQGIEWDVDSMDEFKCLLTKDGGERLIHQFPQKFVECLAGLDEKAIENAAAHWAKTEELACEAGDILPFLDELVPLAIVSCRSGKSMYVWNCV
jgi:hypothetical protein